MTSAPTVEVHVDSSDLRAALEADAREGLTAARKHIPPVYFYDERGSRLFDEITTLPEYYPTRCEREILDLNAKDIAASSRADTLVELGSGTSAKTRLLLDALRDAGNLKRFVPLDVSGQTLREAAAAIAHDYEGVDVHAVVGDFSRHLDRIPSGGRRMVAFLGSTIGNLDPGQRRRFLFDLDCALTSADWLLLGTDLVKDVDVIVAAYNDARGVTAEFNRNVLHVLNRELGATFVPDRFEHVARWDAANEWMAISLRSIGRQTIEVRDLGIEVTFEDGEELATEISAKFRPDGLADELWQAGFVVTDSWTDSRGWFQLTLAKPYC